MNRAQAKRLAQWATGTYLFLTDTNGLDDEAMAAMSLADADRIGRAIQEIGRSMIVRSGIPASLSSTEAIAFLARKEPHP